MRGALIAAAVLLLAQPPPSSSTTAAAAAAAAAADAATMKVRQQQQQQQLSLPVPPLVPAGAVFKPGEAGYACFRAPSLTYASSDRLLAIVEAYKFRCVSRQWCDIVQKVSTDHGLSWSAVSLVHGTGGNGNGNASSPCFQNVSPTLDKTTDKLFLPIHAAFFKPATAGQPPTETSTKVIMLSSTDGGMSYSAPRDVSSEFAHGVPSMPGGTQLPSGRLIVPTYRAGKCPSATSAGSGTVSVAPRLFCSYLVLSDDSGASWRVGAETANGSECMAAALRNGSVLLNMRDSTPGVPPAAAGLCTCRASAP